MLKEQIQQDIKSALVARDKEKVSVLRLIMAAIKQKEVDNRVELDDTAIISVLESMVKQRKESLEQYQSAGRQDLADKEQFELSLLKTYMPEPLSDAEITALIDKVIADTGAASMQDMGKVMGMLKPKIQGRADMGSLSKTIKERLQSS